MALHLKHHRSSRARGRHRARQQKERSKREEGKGGTVQVDSEERGAGPHSRERGRKTPREAEHQTENPRCITPSSLRLPPSCCDPVLPPISPPFPPSLLPPSSLLPAKYGVDYQSFRLPTKSREGEKGGREATIPSHLADPDHDRLHGGCGLCRGACGARSRRVGSRSPDHQ